MVKVQKNKTKKKKSVRSTTKANDRRPQSYHKGEALRPGHPVAAGDLDRASRWGEVPAEGGRTLDLSPPRHTQAPHTARTTHTTHHRTSIIAANLSLIQ